MLELSKWDLDVETNDGEEYTSLVRAVRRTHQRFKLLFVSCSPSQGEKIRCDLMADIPTKKYELLDIKESIDNLYEAINNLPNLSELDVLFIRGLEYSIFEYEDREFGDINKRSQSKVYGGSWAGVPPVLARLNMQRELFRDRFPHICFVFLLPHFAIDYFIRRAPDFYDWKSGIYKLTTNVTELESQINKVWNSENYKEYSRIAGEGKQVIIKEIRACLDEVKDPNQRSKLLFQLGSFYILSGQYSQALKAFSLFLQICPNGFGALSLFSDILAYLEDLQINLSLDEARYIYRREREKLYRYEEAVTSYDKVQIESDFTIDWHNLGLGLFDLGRYEEAVTSYNHVLLKSDIALVWYSRGLALFKLGRYEEAITSYDRAIKIEHNIEHSFAPWYNRGLALFELGRYEEAITSYDRAIKFRNTTLAWYSRGLALFELRRYKESIASYNFENEVKPDVGMILHNERLSLVKQKEQEERIEARINRVLNTIAIGDDVLHGIYKY